MKQLSSQQLSTIIIIGKIDWTLYLPEQAVNSPNLHGDSNLC